MQEILKVKDNSKGSWRTSGVGLSSVQILAYTIILRSIQNPTSQYENSQKFGTETLHVKYKETKQNKSGNINIQILEATQLMKFCVFSVQLQNLWPTSSAQGSYSQACTNCSLYQISQGSARMLRIHLRDSRSLGPSMAELQLITPGVSLLEVSTSVPNLALQDKPMKVRPQTQERVTKCKQAQISTSCILQAAIMKTLKM